MLRSDAAGPKEDGFHCKVTGSLSGQDENRNLMTQGSKFIPLEALNVGYSASTTSQPTDQDEPVGPAQAGGVSGFQPVAEGENSNDAFSVGPETPQRAPEPNPGTPLTPLANLKVLIAAASSALDRERECASAGGGVGVGEVVGASVTVGGEEGTEETTGRKMKSLAVLCKRFLSIAEGEIGAGNEFSLEMMAQSLGTNRRRIYDIINVMEALEMIVKQSKNWYTWLGRGSLLPTLAKLRAMALDDAELSSLFGGEDSHKENATSSCKDALPFIVPGNKESAVGVARKPLQAVSMNRKRSRNHEPAVPVETSTQTEDVTGCQDDREEPIGLSDGDGSCRRWDKSLGVLCQKFVMLFLISPNHEVTLECAGSVLMPDEEGGTPYSAPQNPKTKVRRLYDIANVLTTLALIKKKTFLAPNHRKMPGYTWCGPSISEILAITVLRKTEFSMAPLYPHKKGTSLTRKPFVGSRPFLHQYEVKDSHSSAPATPTKAKEGGFRRSLSFGANNPGSGKSACVVARPLCPKQLDYMKEVKEFEAEMQKHSYRYPHVASVFHEFIQKYQNTLEQSASTGRSILPKPSVSSPQQGGNLAGLPSADLTIAALLASPCSLPRSTQASPESSFPINLSSQPSIGIPSGNALPNSHPNVIHPILKQINIPMPASAPISQVTLAVPAATVASLTAALSDGANPKGSKLFRRILPAPYKDPTTELLQRASEIMNKAAAGLSSTCLPSTQAQDVTSLAHAEPSLTQPATSFFTADSKSSGTLISDVACSTTAVSRSHSHSYGTQTSPVVGTTPVIPAGTPINALATKTPVSSRTDSQGVDNSVTSSTNAATASVDVSETGLSFHSCVTSDSEKSPTAAINSFQSLSNTVVNLPPSVNQAATSASADNKPSPSALGTIALSEAAAFIDANSGGMTLQIQQPCNSLSDSSASSGINNQDNRKLEKTSTAQTDATHGTLHSPSNPARTGRTFVNVKDVLTLAGDRTPTPAATSTANIPPQPLSAPEREGGRVLASSVVLPAFSMSQLSPPPGVHPLSIFGTLPPVGSKQSAFTSIVNQKPIPSVFESNQSTPQPVTSTTASSCNVGPLLQSFGITNPNVFLANPGASRPVCSGFLPPISSLYSNGHRATNRFPLNTQAVTTITNNYSLISRSNGASPPKRPRLE